MHRKVAFSIRSRSRCRLFPASCVLKVYRDTKEPEGRMLDALYSVPLVVAYADGMKLEEIAAALHVPKGTVSARMTRGRQKLKTWMEEER